MYKIACQTIVFGDHIKENIETILPAVKKMGYDGVEIGVRHFDKEKPEYYRDLLKKNELELLAIHVGGNFLEPDSVQKQIDQFEDTLRFACELGIHYIFISGFHKKGKTEDDYKEEAAVYMGNLERRDGLPYADGQYGSGIFPFGSRCRLGNSRRPRSG